ncbi:MAG: radical SAM protein [Deltaproteobacteria bacterium]|nr:radical SAM protein [Deltaproteobacteria bacterium]
MGGAASIPRFERAFAGLGYDLATLLRRLDETGERDELSAAGLRRAWAECVRDARRGRGPTRFGCYIHIPFCRQRCAYCRHFQARLESPAQLERYLGVLDDAFAYYSPAFRGVRFGNLIVGGGTPGILEAEALEHLLRRLFAAFAFDESPGDRAFEFNPAGVTAGKLRVLARYGFRRVSMGVQSMSARVLDAQNRGYQTGNVLDRAFALVRDSGIAQLCVDLIAGLAGDDTTGFRESFAALARRKPDQITVYPLVPTTLYLRQRFGGDFGAFLARRREFLAEVVPWMHAHAGHHGYRSERERDGPGDNAWVFNRCGVRRLAAEDEEFYDDTSSVPASIFGLGPGAGSSIWGRLVCTDRGPIPGRFDPRERRYWATRRDRRDEMARFVLMNMRKHGEVRRDQFRRSFGTDLVDEYPVAVARLASLGLARLDPGRLRLRSGTGKRRFLCAVPFLDRKVLQRALRGGADGTAPFVRVSSRTCAAEFAVEHALPDVAYLRVLKGLGLRLLYAGEQQTPSARSLAGRATMLRLAQRAFAAAVRASRHREPAAVARVLHARLRRAAARLGLLCRLARPVG